MTNPLKNITDIYFPHDKKGSIADCVKSSFYYSYSDKAIKLYDDDMKCSSRTLEATFTKLVHEYIKQEYFDEWFFSFNFIHDDGEYDFRGNNTLTKEGKLVHLRVIQECPSLDDLRLSSHIKNALLSPDLIGGGLIIYIAQNGQGKSTFMDATIIERLKRYGGYCITCENPKEANIEGFHRDGYCSQQSVDKNRSMTDLIINATRSLPAIGHNILMIGEATDTEAVVQAIEASANGNIVLFTGHGSSIDDYLYKLVAMYSSVKSEKLAWQLLSSTLKVAIHWDRLWDPKADGWMKGIYKGKYLSVVNKNNDTHAIESVIREGKLKSLKQYYKTLE